MARMHTTLHKSQCTGGVKWAGWYHTRHDISGYKSFEAINYIGTDNQAHKQRRQNTKTEAKPQPIRPNSAVRNAHLRPYFCAQLWHIVQHRKFLTNIPFATVWEIAITIESITSSFPRKSLGSAIYVLHGKETINDNYTEYLKLRNRFVKHERLQSTNRLNTVQPSQWVNHMKTITWRLHEINKPR